MKTAARIQAAIDVLAEIAGTDRPAEQRTSGYFRKRRYIGSKDRKAIAALVFAVLRHRARIRWWLDRHGIEAPSSRIDVFAFLLLSGGENAESLAGLCGSEPYGPEPLEASEKAILERLSGQPLTTAEQPASVRLEVPDWLMPSFARAFGEEAAPELAALLEEAPLDLRCNALKAERDQALAALAAEGIEAVPTPLSPLGLRVPGRRAVQTGRAFTEGLVEIQDEGSQIAALLCDARPGMAVADVCAGGGGKALALAGAMAGRGRLLASDRDQGRLDRAAARFRRAGAGFIERRTIGDLGAADDLAGGFDRVLVDAPCSGSGAWRRQPDARWRLTRDRLAEFLALQREILSKAAALVRPGGRLIYVTCSLLPEENRDQVDAFLKGHPTFALRPVPQVWPQVLDVPCPSDEPCLTLTPARHGTDGFFVAIFDRREAA